MGMIDSGKNLRLSLEEEQSLLCCLRMKVRNAVDAYRLHCHLPVESRIASQVDDSHRAPAELAFDLVPADARHQLKYR